MQGRRPLVCAEAGFISVWGGLGPRSPRSSLVPSKRRLWSEGARCIASKLETAWWALGQEPGGESARAALGEPGTPEESHRQCTGRGGGGGKRKHSARAPGKRAAQDGAEPSLQASATSPRRREEAGVGRKGSRSSSGDKGLLCVCPHHPRRVHSDSPAAEMESRAGVPRWNGAKGIWGSSSSPSRYIPVGCQHGGCTLMINSRFNTEMEKQDRSIF